LVQQGDQNVNRPSIRQAALLVSLAAIATAAACGAPAVWNYREASAPVESVDWPTYGRDPGGSRYSPLRQVTRSNVRYLEPIWVYRTGDWSDGTSGNPKTAFEATPIVVDGVLYVSTIYGRVIALEPETGREIWTFDPHVDRAVRRAEIGNRGVATWVGPKREDGSPAPRRIFVATIDARLIAVDAATGRPCADFGKNGQIDLTQGAELGETKVSKQDYGVTSAPAILNDLVIVGSAIGDNRAVTVERGIVRAFDVRSGQLRWLFDPVPRDPADPAWETWENESARHTGAGNVWAPISVDYQRDLVLLPTSSPSPDYYGGQRLGRNRYADSVVALRGATGKVVWDYQIVHHDLWDYDLPAQPTLVTIHKNGEEIPAVAQATKMGFLFLLDRTTGKPIFPVEERPVPVSDVPGERSSPTQPFPTLPPPLAPTTLSPDDAWGPTPGLRARARELIRQYRSEGIFTPPSLKGSIQYPGIAGGTNWGGVAFEPEYGLLVLNMTHIPFVVQLIPRESFTKESAAQSPNTEFGRQLGTPYVISRRPLLSPVGLPCSPPPWGTLLAVDLSKGFVKWQVPLGTIRDLTPVPIPIRLGVPNMGGPMVTGGRLVFIGAAVDNYIRAFDVDSGDELWKRRLPAGGQATPMTFSLAGTGKQYVVIAAGGHGKLGTTIGDYVVAFALRSRWMVAVLWVLETLLALVLVLFAIRYLLLRPWPELAPYSRLKRWRRCLARGCVRFFGAVLWSAAVALVLPGVIKGETWLIPLSASVAAGAVLLLAALSLARWRVRALGVDAAVFALASMVASSEMGELFWVGVLRW
jgi:quinoprotein glucose dehydrogenase